MDTDLHACPEADMQFDRALEGLLHTRPNTNADCLREAYRFACDSHAGQSRCSGEPYITHPVAVMEILVSLEMDDATLCAALLHDVAEDASVTMESLAERFGAEVATLVDGVTKLQIAGADPFLPSSAAAAASPQEEERARRHDRMIRSAANLRKIFLAMAKDLRVMVIKLADRLHNMRTLSAMPPEKQKRIAEETLQIYAPLAHRLGIWQLKWELEDLAFKYSNPEEYRRVAEAVALTRNDRQEEVSQAVEILSKHLQAEGIDARVMGRPKHLYSIYQKMLKQELDFHEIYDLVALRVIVHMRPECYHALGVLHALWPPIPGMYTDYIARSKSNLYQSLHTKVIGPNDRPLEIQIRTWEMHRTAEFGVAAHWAYKENGEGGKATDQFERKLSWLRQQLFDWQADARNSSEFLHSVIEELITDQVLVFTPRGDVIDLPAGATPVDFAYRIHSDVGNKAVGAKVNTKIVPLSYQFKQGDMVEIITRSNATPSRDWLSFCKTSHAKSKIKHYFRRLRHDENVQAGREALSRELDRLGLDSAGLLKDEVLAPIASLFNVPNEVELLAAVGYGTVAVNSVINKLNPNFGRPERGLVVGKGRSDESKLRIVAGAVDNVMFRRSRCCLPIPGDEVIGYITRGRGMALHRKECPNIALPLATEPERLTPVEYAGGGSQVYSVNLLIETFDRTGLLADVGSVFGELKTNITAVRTQSHRDRTATLAITVEVKDVEHLNRVFLAVRRLPDILNIERAGSGQK